MNEWKRHIDLAALEAWMDAQGLGTGAVQSAKLLVGGTQNMLLQFERDGRSFVLRRPPPSPRATSDETMRREMRVLSALAQTDVPHPRLLAACPQTDALGVSFYLMEFVGGFNPTSGLPPSYCRAPSWRHKMALALVAGAARLGSVDYRRIGLGDFGQPDHFLERQVPRWIAQYEGYAASTGWPGSTVLPDIDRVANWLEHYCPASFRPGLMHGDYHFANVIFYHDRPELAAIVDWELATIGDPLIDLGWLLATWPERSDGSDTPVEVRPWAGFPPTLELIKHYAARSDRDLSSLDWYRILGCFKLAILLEGTHARACAGEASRAVGARLHASATALMRRARALIA